MRNSEKTKTQTQGTNRGELIRVTYPANAKKKKRETQAAFLRRVGTYTVMP